MKKNIIELLSPSVKKILDEAITLSKGKNYRIYIVGGAVRDYLMSKKPVDLDIVVEGNGMELAQIIANRLGYEIVSHHKFLTATIRVNNSEVDFTTARREIYKKPARLPEVTPASLIEDLERRDFTINAIAMSLNDDDYLKVIDPFNGIEDIKKGIIRILHRKSFIDDPTRAFRAVRYATRFGFKIEKETEELIYSSLRGGVFNELTPSRIFNEIKLLMNEERPDLCAKNLMKYNLLGVFLNRVRIPERQLLVLKQIPSIVKKNDYHEQWRISLLALLDGIDKEGREFFIRRYPLDRKCINTINQLGSFEKILPVINRKLKNSEVFTLLKNYPDEVLLYEIARNNSRILRKNIENFLKLKNIKPLVNGEDLRKFKIPAGPLYSRILNDIHLLYLDGKLKTKKSALKIILQKYRISNRIKI